MRVEEEQRIVPGTPRDTSITCDMECDRGTIGLVKSWEIIADSLSKAGWRWGCVSAVTSDGRTIWIADAHRDGKRFVVRADEKLTAFAELESVIRPTSGKLHLLWKRS